MFSFIVNGFATSVVSVSSVISSVSFSKVEIVSVFGV
jgi:hypothetical protein